MNKFVLPIAGMTIKLTSDFSFRLGVQGYYHRVDIREKLFPKRHDTEDEIVALQEGTILYLDKIDIGGIKNCGDKYYGDFIIFKIRETDHPELKFQRGKNKAIFRLNHQQIQELEFEIVK